MLKGKDPELRRVGPSISVKFYSVKKDLTSMGVRELFLDKQRQVMTKIA